MLKKIYGEMILKKGSILYHTSDDSFQINYTKPMLFCTFHPSEWDIINEYVTYIKIKKDISLLFMIETCNKARIFSSLNSFTNHPNLNLAKKNPDQLSCYVNELKKENFDGWFTSIENKVTVEVALINNPNLYEVINTKKLRRNWRNGGEGKLKKWGKKYDICTIQMPVILNINKRYKDIIEEYKKYELNSGFFKEFIFQVILENAIIHFHKGTIKKIKWNC